MFSTRLLSILLLALYPISTLPQQLIPNNLPTCAATCAQLQNAQSSCTPAGGAPVSNQATYQSCFCQSALLTTLKSPGAQLCTQCSSSDNTAIASWYQGFCKAGVNPATAPVSSASQAATAGAPQATSSISQVQNNPAQTSGATVVGNSQGITNNAPTGPWFSTHWRWIVMLVVLIIGLTAFAVVFSILHKRYHQRRESQWAQSTVSHPDINTWGPGQSVHDFGVHRAASNLKRSLSRSLSRGKRNQSSNAEKGKATSGVAEVHPMPPMPAYKPEREGTGFGARQPSGQNVRFSRGGRF